MRLLKILAVTAIFLFVGSLQAQLTGSMVTTETISTRSAGDPKRVPFSADVINESIRILADGTRIQQVTHGKSFRDSEGRTRTESELIAPTGTGEKFQHISIFDPVQKFMISLDPRNKTATIHPWPVRPAHAADANVAKSKASESTHEQLGTMEIEGFSATGIRSTQTIEAGKIGNDKPLVRVTEIWLSRDLATSLQTKTDDPQFGQNTMKLVNIHTGEPDPLLFQVPQGYTVIEAPAQK